ncbi:MAG: YgiT-type zinc finger protein [Byssovorax sp.]
MIITVFQENSMIRCSVCEKGTLAPGRTKEHDIGPLFGLDRVLLDRAPALICEECGHVVLDGETIEAARRKLAVLIVRNRSSLTGREARFLRETMNMTQAQLADRLQIIRGTVTRWEAGEDLGPVQSFALRTLAAWALGGEQLAHSVSAPDVPQPAPSPPGPYRIDQAEAA